MKIEDVSTEDLIAQLDVAPEEFAIDDFDRWCISSGIKQGEHVVHKDWLYKVYMLTNYRNPKRYRYKPFFNRLSKNIKLEGDNFYCNTSLDAFKRLLSEAGFKDGGETAKGIKTAENRFKRFIEAAEIKDGEELVRLDMLYKVYLDYASGLGKGKKASYGMWETVIPTLLKTRNTINHVWVMINPDYKREFVHGEAESEEQETEGQVSCVESGFKSQDEV